MKTFVRLAFSLFIFSGTAYAQTNPYMPGGGSYSGPMTDQQRQELIQSILSGHGTGVGEYVPSQQDQMPAPQPTPVAPVAPPAALPSAELEQELKLEQANDLGAIAREKADREQELSALKDAVDGQIRDMQRKIDDMQKEIDDLRYSKDRL